jgi:cysteinyl-tRNA synthetase
MMAGARVEASEAKEDPMDFVLWKESKSGEPSWDSPWGKGRPGWHIECSAMSRKFLGDRIDIHGGGQDVVFPHHENEIAQSEAFTGKKPFVQYWMHNGLLRMGEEKMSKSLGNLITIRDALKKYTADAIRIFILSSYYRSPLTYTEEAIQAAQSGADRMLRVAAREDAAPGKGKALDAKPYYDRFIEAMDDDFNTPQAIAALFDLARDINQAGDAGDNVSEAQNTLTSLGRQVLGLKLNRHDVTIILSNVMEATASAPIPNIDIQSTPGVEVVKLLVDERIKCRKAKLWQKADEIRDRLSDLGVTLEDTKTGTTATYKLVPSEEALVNLMKELGITLENKS